MQRREIRHWWVVKLWCVVVLPLFIVMLALGVAMWLVTGDLSKYGFFIVLALFMITSLAFSVHTLHSVNIFGSMRKTRSRSGYRLVYLSALGLYLGVAAVIFFATFFIFLQLMQMPRMIVAAIGAVEFALFLVVGYIGFTRLRRSMQWLSETENREVPHC